MRKRNPSGMRKKSTWDALSRWEHFQQQWRPLSWWIGVENIGLLYSEHSVCYHVTQTHCVFNLCVAVLPVYNETIVLPIASPNVQTLHMSRPCSHLLHIFFHLEVKAELTWKNLTWPTIEEKLRNSVRSTAGSAFECFFKDCVDIQKFHLWSLYTWRLGVSK